MKKQTLFTLFGLLFTLHAWAQHDVINLTWTAGSNENKFLYVLVTAGEKNVEIKWGDGLRSIHNGREIDMGTPLSHTYTQEGTYDVSIQAAEGTELMGIDCDDLQIRTLDISGAAALDYLICHSNQLESLDLTQNTALTYINCSSNKLTGLDISQNTLLGMIECHGNRLPLSDLYTISKKIPSQKWATLGTQTWTTTDIQPNTPFSLAGQMTLAGVQTTVTATTPDAVLTHGTDYVVDYTAETITFLKAIANCEVTLTNTAISSNQNYPAKLVIPFDIKSVHINFSWKGAGQKEIFIYATEGKKLAVDWGDGNTERFEGQGTETKVALSHTYSEEGPFSVNILTSDGEEVTTLLCPSAGLQSLNIDKAAALKYLDCSDNLLQDLDLSNNTALEFLYCNENQLQTLDVSNNTALKNLYCDYNQLQSLDISNNIELMALAFIYNQLQNLDISNNLKLKELYCDINQLQTLDLSSNLELKELTCSENQLQSLDISSHVKLTELGCAKNQLQRLDISNNPVLTRINCQSNQLPLSDLYAISQQLNNGFKMLGNQTWLQQNIETHTPYSLSGQMLPGGVETTFAVTKAGAPATPGTDYHLDYNGQTITFPQTGSYEAVLTNTAITSDAFTTARVVIPFEVALSTDATLSGLTISSGTLSPAFSSAVTAYRVSLPTTTDELTIDATANHPNATTSGDTGLQSLKIGANTFTITVTAEDGDTQLDYTLTVTRQPPYVPGNDAHLRSLDTDRGTLTPAFHTATTHYTLTVDGDVEEITLTAEPNDPYATLSGTGTHKLHIGENPFHITVTAEDGTTNTYTITVTRQNTVGNTPVNTATIRAYPSDGALCIQSDEYMQEIRLYHPNGKLHFHRSDAAHAARTPPLPPSIYILIVKTPKEQAVNKIVVP